MHASNQAGILREFHSKGYVVIENVIDHKVILELHAFAKNQIIEYSKELGISFAKYTYCTGRWGPSSRLFLNALFSDVNVKLQQLLEKLLDHDLLLKKQNVICKNQHITGKLALHQDISYSYNSPYNFTLWLALDDVLPNSGEMIVIPQSHKWPITRAMDFWSPFFKDKALSKYSDMIQRIYIKKGSALLFDSRLWHGSTENTSGASRYAYVTRWLMEGYKFATIPKPQSLEFGMWNCHEQLIQILSNAKQYTPLDNSSFVALLETTKRRLNTSNVSDHDKAKAAFALDNLITLHKASYLHDAGDLCGKIYMNVWYDLLSKFPLCS